MEPLVAVYDACVLYSQFLRDFLVRLAIRGRAARIFRAKWTGRIHQEWTRAVLRENPQISRATLSRTRRLMDEHVGGCRVTGYRRWESRLTLPDPDDRHVLAAALACVADVIVTSNLKDFPAATLAPFGVVARVPDDFAQRFRQTGPAHQAILVATAAEHRASLRRPAMTAPEYLDALRENSLPTAADFLTTQTI